MALPKANRLRSRRDFQTVFRLGIRRSSPNLTLRALRLLVKTPTEAQPNATPKLLTLKPSAPAKIGIAVSTKVSKRAVVRNRIKRQVQAAFYQLLPRLAAGWLLVVVVKPSAVQECEYQQFLQELEQLLAEAEVLNGHS